MARPLRLNIEGGWYHVTTRGTERKVVYKDDECRLCYIGLLEELVARFNVKIHAYVLMPNHTHLVLETPTANLSVAMQWLNTSYSMWFNRREHRVGPLLQGRFKAVLFDGSSQAWPVTKYVHLNPIRKAGLDLSKNMTKAEAMGIRPVSAELIKRRQEVLKDCKWSSYQYYAGWRKTPAWLSVEDVLAGSDKKRVKDQREAYRSYVESAMGEAMKDSPIERAASGFLLGSQDWIERMKGLLRGDRKEQKAFRKLEKRPEWNNVRKAVEHVKGEKWADFCDRYGDWGRDMALYVGRRRCGMKLNELGIAAGITSYYTVAQAVKRMGSLIKEDKAMLKNLEAIINCTNIKT